MTQMEVTYRYQSRPSEPALRALDSIREVYGIRRISLNDQDQTIRIEYDASRFKEPVVASLLRRAGVEIQERFAEV